MRRKVLSLCLAAVMALSLAACGSETASVEETTVSQEATEEESTEETEEVTEEATSEETTEETTTEEATEEVTEEATASDAEAVEPVEAGIYVSRLELSDDFVMGVDVSSYVSEKAAGVKYYDFDGNELDDQGFFDFLAECGVNYVRVRVWNMPYDLQGNGYGGGNCGLEVAEEIGKYATAAGMKLMVDFHYSDFWADPSKQTVPRAWATYDMDEKCQALYDFTYESLTTLIETDGIDVGMVQVGNETNYGLAGEKDWSNMVKLMQSGSEAVHAVSEDILVALHFTDPQNEGFTDIAAKLDDAGVDYDVFASSYYPYWHGTVNNIALTLKTIATTYDKKVMIAETSYIHTYEDGDGHPNTESEGNVGDEFYYPVSEQGQADAIYYAAYAVSVSGDYGLGICYWEPAWIPVNVFDEDSEDAASVLAANKKAWEEYGCGWAASYAGDYDADAAEYYGGSAVDNEALFNLDGTPLESLMTFSYLRTGATTQLKAVSATVNDITINTGEEFSLPKIATITYNNKSTGKLEVTWDEDSVSAVDNQTPGDYVVTGTVDAEGETFEVSLTVTVSADSVLENGSFEDSEAGVWDISADIMSVDKDGSNTRTGEYCLHFWDSADFEVSAEQTVTLDAGTYTYGGYVEGGDVGDDAELYIYVSIDGDVNVMPVEVTGWAEWHNVEITGIEVPGDGTEVTVGLYVRSAAGGWGAWDDMYLYLE